MCRGAWRSVAKTLEKTVARLRSRRCSAAQAPALSLTEGHPTGGRQEGRPGSVGVGLAGGRGRRGRGGGEEGRPSLGRVERGREEACRSHTHTTPLHPSTPHQVRGTTRFHPPPSLSPVTAPHQGLTRHLPSPPQAVCGGLRPGLRARGAREKQREGGGEGAPARVLFCLLPHLPAPHTARFPPPPAYHRGQARAAKAAVGWWRRAWPGCEGKRGREEGTRGGPHRASAHAAPSERARRAAPSHRSPLSLSSPSPDSFRSSPALSPTQK